MLSGSRQKKMTLNLLELSIFTSFLEKKYLFWIGLLKLICGVGGRKLTPSHQVRNLPWISVNRCLIGAIGDFLEVIEKAKASI